MDNLLKLFFLFTLIYRFVAHFVKLLMGNYNMEIFDKPNTFDGKDYSPWKPQARYWLNTLRLLLAILGLTQPPKPTNIDGGAPIPWRTHKENGNKQSISTYNHIIIVNFSS